LGPLIALIGVPLALGAVFILVLMARPTWYWPWAVIFVVAFQIPLVAVYMSSGLASVALAPLILQYLFSNGADMQSTARARRYSASELAEAVESRPERPTRVYAIMLERPGRWANFTVPIGLPHVAFAQRRTPYLLLDVANLVLAAIWAAMMVYTRSAAAWTAFALVAPAPLALALLGRRSRVAGVRSIAGASAVVQVVDAIRPELREVDLSSGLVVRRDADATWVALRPERGSRSFERGLLVAAPKSWAGTAEEPPTLDDATWRRVIWFGGSLAAGAPV